MKKYIILLLLIILPINIIAQQFYVYCPDYEVKSRVNVEGAAYIAIKDGRVFGKGYNERRQKCNSDEILNEITNFIHESFPYMKIYFLDENQFNKEPKEGELTFKIEIKKYDAFVKSYTWHANTEFEVSIFDNRKNEEPIIVNCKEFKKNLSRGPAVRGSFKIAFEKILLLIEKEMTEDIHATKVNPSSKYKKLKELKILLDDGILTQEEFDNEKKKILDENYK